MVPAALGEAAIPAAISLTIFLLIDHLMDEFWGLGDITGDLHIFIASHLAPENHPSSRDWFCKIFFSWCTVLQDPYPLSGQLANWRTIILQKFCHRSENPEPQGNLPSLRVWHQEEPPRIWLWMSPAFYCRKHQLYSWVMCTLRPMGK